MPPSFMARNSRSSSGFETAAPNHHQRIMMRASSGGFSKFPRRLESVCEDPLTARRVNNAMQRITLDTKQSHVGQVGNLRPIFNRPRGATKIGPPTTQN